MEERRHADGTTMVKDIAPGAASSSPQIADECRRHALFRRARWKRLEPALDERRHGRRYVRRAKLRARPDTELESKLSERRERHALLLGQRRDPRQPALEERRNGRGNHDGHGLAAETDLPYSAPSISKLVGSDGAIFFEARTAGSVATDLPERRHAGGNFGDLHSRLVRRHA